MISAWRTPVWTQLNRRHTPWSRVRYHGCRFTHSKFHSRRHSLRITLKYTTLVWMRSSWNRDNGASDVWALTAYSKLRAVQCEVCADTNKSEVPKPAPHSGVGGTACVFPKSPVKGYFSCDKVRPENCKKGGYLTFHPEISFKKGVVFLSLSLLDAWEI